MDTILHVKEYASNTIISTVEENEKLLAHLLDGMDDAAKLDMIVKISASNLGLFECYFFQNITDQRITRVVKFLTYVEGRVTALIDAWVKTEVKKVTVDRPKNKPRMKNSLMVSNGTARA